jgi:hypothetical protein
MTARGTLITFTLAVLAPVLLWPADARATAKKPVFIPPILHNDTNKPDQLLNQAFGAAVSLRVPADADWRLSAPDPAACRNGCQVIRISGRRAPEPRYVLRVYDFPGGQEISTNHLKVPSGTTIPLIADALLLKCSFLFGVELNVGPRRPRTVASRTAPPPPPPSRPPPPAPRVKVRRRSPREVKRRLDLSASAVTFVGSDSLFLSIGAEVSAAVRIVGFFALKAALGGQGAGRVGFGTVQFHAVAFSLLAGAQWSWRWWQAGVFGGGTLMFIWVRFEDLGSTAIGNTRATGLTGGPTLEGRGAVRVHTRVSLGISLRLTYLINKLRMRILDQFDNVLSEFRAAHVVWHPTLDVTVRF